MMVRWAHKLLKIDQMYFAKQNEPVTFNYEGFVLSVDRVLIGTNLRMIFRSSSYY